ncbi:glycosyl hydrolase family 28-related protein [Novosphingobium sp. PY1]|uniref:glycosyl hydrolase family 28-related protein n=1 Tax=Novosphingobium sp. PY1 TaxID=1882221 RepID=UPI001A8D0B64|nr:glycosyl hydrolase family 28-related protein [Novosphingobium sp. PY1]GFM31470.1 Gp49 [Novosphingobium sp. PY1]
MLLIGATLTASAQNLQTPSSFPLAVAENIVLPGCAGDGKRDDTACLQDWINKRQGGMLNLGTGIYLIHSPLVSQGAITLVGAGGGQGIYKQSCTSGLRSNDPRQDVLILKGAGSRVYNLCIDANRPMEAGSAIRISGHASSVIVSDSHIYNQVTSIAVSGTGPGGATQNADVVLRHNTIVPAAHPQAVGIAIGRESMRANTVDTRVEGNSLVCQKRLGVGTLIADGGGTLIRNNTQYGCAIGTKIYPGAHQMVTWLYFSNTVLGDTDAEHNLVLDTQTSTAAIWGLNFTGTWASNADSDSILIQDSGESHNILGVHFTGHRTYMAKDQSGIVVKAGQKITFDAGTICSDGDGNGAGFVVSGTALATAVRNSTIGNCDHNSAGTLATGIEVTTSANNVGIFIGNDLSTVTTPILWKPRAENAAEAVLGDNLGVDTVEGSAVTAERVDLPPNRIIFLSGSGVVKWLRGGWADRETILVPSSGTITFATGGNICSALDARLRQKVTAVFMKAFQCWSLS